MFAFLDLNQARILSAIGGVGVVLRNGDDEMRVLAINKAAGKDLKGEENRSENEGVHDVGMG
jgi:hypothetical protein